MFIKLQNKKAFILPKIDGLIEIIEYLVGNRSFEKSIQLPLKISPSYNNDRCVILQI